MRKRTDRPWILILLAGLLCAVPLAAQEADDEGRESIVRSSSDKEIVIVSYDPAPGASARTQKERIRIKRIYANWISAALSQWRRQASPALKAWPRMSARELSRAYQSYLRFLRNVEPESSSYLAVITDEDDRRKIIARLKARTAEKIKNLQSGY
jgi:hypothetical protein